MKTNSPASFFKQTIMTCLLALGPPLLAQAQNEQAIQWINAASQNGATQLNSTGTFTTSFQGTNDVTVTQLTGNVSGLVNNSFGGATPGNNPGYITSFLGSPTTGTGTGTAGTFGLLGGDGTDATASLEIDFSVPLTLNSHIMFGDVDTTEQYQIQAYSLVDGTYVQLSLAGWAHNSFSGQTGITPNASWATWNPSNGTLTAPAGNPQLNSPLDVLTPDHGIDRIVVSKLAGTGGGWAFDVVDGVPEPSTTSVIGISALGLCRVLRLRRNARVSCL